MGQDRRKVLDMLAAGTITADEAEKLLEALGNPPTPSENTGVGRRGIKYLRVVVDAREDGVTAANVNVRVPLQLLRAGVKLTSLIPRDAQEQVNQKLREKGIEFDVANVSPETLDELIDSLGELTVDVDAGDANEGAKVRVFCE